jgi:hypothetical protein
MLEPLWSYVMALLYFGRLQGYIHMAECLQTLSHDRLTRMVHGSWSGQILLEQAVRLLFTVGGGYLELDDFVVEKPAAEHLHEAAWVYSTRLEKVVFGIPVVLLVWTNGRWRIPLAFRVWHKGGPSKVDLALDLLSYARNRLRCKPEYVIFDSWYAAYRLLKRIKDYGWYFVCQLKNNRLLDAKALKRFRSHPYWHHIGRLSGGLKVLAARHRRKYFATNRLTLKPKEVRRLYALPQQIEEVHRVLKGQLSIQGCQAGYHRGPQPVEGTSTPQEKHIALCLLAYVVLERERIDQGLSCYQLKRRLISQGFSYPLPALERLRAAA